MNAGQPNNRNTGERKGPDGGSSCMQADARGRQGGAAGGGNQGSSGSVASQGLSAKYKTGCNI